MMKEYRTIQEVAGPLMLIRDVSGVAYDELGEIELPNGELRRCRVLEINGSHKIVEKLSALWPENKDTVAKYASLLYDQALLIEGLPIEDPVAFSNAVCELMQ